MRNYLPITAWICTFFFVTILILFFQNFKNDEKLGAALLFYHNDLNQIKLTNQNKTPIVVALGSSLLLKATKKKINQQNFILFNFAIFQASIDQFIEISTIIDDLKPKIILIESNLMIFQKENASMLFDAKRGLKYFLSEKYRNQFNKAQQKYYDLYSISASTNKKQDGFKKALETIKQRRLRSDKLDSDFLSFYRLFVNKGIKLIFIDIPYSNQIQKELNLKKIKNDFFKTWSQNFNIDTWQYPFAMDSSLYSDHSHLNETGGELYSKWLNKKIEAEVKK